MSTVLLTEEQFIAKGSHKQCFRHPQQERQCIKVPYNQAGQTDLNREIHYLTHILGKRGAESGILPAYYGPVETNLGTGHCFELVCDADGKISASIETILNNPACTSQQITQIHDALLHLRNQMLKYRIIAMSIYPENILYQRLGENNFRLVLINDMGSSSVLPLEYFLAPLAKAKIKRYWNRFVQNSIPHRLPPTVADALADLTF
ncbi:MAG: hypothetical protein IKN49_06080 [Elusimicrobiaceae bacterium]|nr:hypothetical protein [Elusimicrobiaceae bacterium]